RLLRGLRDLHVQVVALDRAGSDELDPGELDALEVEVDRLRAAGERRHLEVQLLRGRRVDAEQGARRAAADLRLRRARGLALGLQGVLRALREALAGDRDRARRLDVERARGPLRVVVDDRERQLLVLRLLLRAG